MRYLIIVLMLLLPITANATVIFEFNGESGYQYMGSANAHPGGGYFSAMGGSISAPEGTYDSSACTPDTTNYHYSVLSSDVAAQGASAGSTHAIKTPYLGVCPNQAFQRDTTIISTPLLQEYWIKWNQKWTGNFQASVQQKFAKFYYSGDTLEKTMSGYFVMRPAGVGATTSGPFQAYFNNIGELLDRECSGLGPDQTWISPVGPCSLPNHSYDSSAATTTPITFDLDRWYTIELHSKMNSANDVADAVLEIWVDGVLRLQLTNFKMRDGGGVYNSPGTDHFEFQHIYYDRSSSNQTTYMDNIIISTTAIDGLPSDTTAPLVTSFTCTSGNKLRDITCTGTATDNVGVTGYCLTTAADSSGCIWQTAGVFRHKPAASGAYTYHLFAKDAAGNVSITTAGSVASKVVETCGCN